MIKRNFQWTKCLLSIQLIKCVKTISEVTITLAKIVNLVFGRKKISEVISKVFGKCALAASLYSSVIKYIKCFRTEIEENFQLVKCSLRLVTPFHLNLNTLRRC